MKHQHAPLAVTLVCGLAGAGKSAVARELSGAAPTGPSRLAPPSADGADEFAFDLAEFLCELADDGQRGHVVVEIGSEVDAVETGLIVEAVVRARELEAPAVVLRELVVVASVPQVRRLLFGDVQGGGAAGGDAAGGDTADFDTVDFELAESLARQLEFGTSVVLTHCDDVPAARLLEVVGLVSKLNPRASVIRLASDSALNGDRHPRAWRTRPAGAATRAPLGQAMGWALELSGQAGPPVSVAGVSSFVFSDPRPFHPGRLAEVVAHCLVPDRVGTILRSRGLVRLASRVDSVGSWASAGGVLSLDPTSMVSWHTDSPAGQEIAFFGLDLRPHELGAALSAALLSDDELVAGPMEWARYPDEFPVWAGQHDH